MPGRTSVNGSIKSNYGLQYEGNFKVQFQLWHSLPKFKCPCKFNKHELL